MLTNLLVGSQLELPVVDYFVNPRRLAFGNWEPLTVPELDVDGLDGSLESKLLIVVQICILCVILLYHHLLESFANMYRVFYSTEMKVKVYVQKFLV